MFLEINSPHVKGRCAKAAVKSGANIGDLDDYQTAIDMGSKMFLESADCVSVVIPVFLLFLRSFRKAIISNQIAYRMKFTVGRFMLDI